MNSTIKPFDNLNVRKAVVAASDRKALQLTRGGTAAGDLATHFLPVDFPGFEDAGGAKGPSLDFMANPSGDMALAKKYMLAAKKEDPSLPIDADGKWTGLEPAAHGRLQRRPGKKTAEVAQAQFEKLGFKISSAPSRRTRSTRSSATSRRRRSPSARTSAGSRTSTIRRRCWTPCSTARTSSPQNNSNWTQLNVPAINDAMAKAALLPAGPARNKAWGQIDDMVTAQAPGDPVPVGQDPHGRVV